MADRQTQLYLHDKQRNRFRKIGKGKGDIVESYARMKALHWPLDYCLVEEEVSQVEGQDNTIDHAGIDQNKIKYMRKAELIDVANSMGITVHQGMTKSEIRSAILDATNNKYPEQ